MKKRAQNEAYPVKKLAYGQTEQKSQLVMHVRVWIIHMSVTNSEMERIIIQKEKKERDLL